VLSIVARPLRELGRICAVVICWNSGHSRSAFSGVIEVEASGPGPPAKQALVCAPRPYDYEVRKSQQRSCEGSTLKSRNSLQPNVLLESYFMPPFLELTSPSLFRFGSPWTLTSSPGDPGGGQTLCNGIFRDGIINAQGGFNSGNILHKARANKTKLRPQFPVSTMSLHNLSFLPRLSCCLGHAIASLPRPG
jgi:hypothetical protein